jgi:hypothetical protein
MKPDLHFWDLKNIAPYSVRGEYVPDPENSIILRMQKRSIKDF